jgi:hypothetical protein
VLGQPKQQQSISEYFVANQEVAKCTVSCKLSNNGDGNHLHFHFMFSSLQQTLLVLFLMTPKRSLLLPGFVHCVRACMHTVEIKWAVVLQAHPAVSLPVEGV